MPRIIVANWEHDAIICRQGIHCGLFLKRVLYVHDNAGEYIFKITQKKIITQNLEVLPHPSYFSDLVESDYSVTRI